MMTSDLDFFRAHDAHTHATPGTLAGRRGWDVPDAHAHAGCLAHPRHVRACRTRTRG